MGALLVVLASVLGCTESSLRDRTGVSAPPLPVVDVTASWSVWNWRAPAAVSDGVLIHLVIEPSGGSMRKTVAGLGSCRLALEVTMRRPKPWHLSSPLTPIGLPVAGQRWRRQQRGRVRRRQNAAEVVAEQLVCDLHPRPGPGADSLSPHGRVARPAAGTSRPLPLPCLGRPARCCYGAERPARSRRLVGSSSPLRCLNASAAGASLTRSFRSFWHATC